MFLFRELYCDVTQIVNFCLATGDIKSPVRWATVKNLYTRDIKQWWLISEHLYKQLLKAGEPVAKDKVNHYWGRTHTGKPVFDPVITTICVDMQILQGQKFEWK